MVVVASAWVVAGGTGSAPDVDEGAGTSDVLEPGTEPGSGATPPQAATSLSRVIARRTAKTVGGPAFNRDKPRRDTMLQNDPDCAVHSASRVEDEALLRVYVAPQS